MKGKKDGGSHKNNGKLSPLKEGVSKTGTKENSDMPIFQDNLLPVTCRKAKGVLHKNRFSTGMFLAFGVGLGRKVENVLLGSNGFMKKHKTNRC